MVSWVTIGYGWGYETNSSPFHLTNPTITQTLP